MFGEVVYEVFAVQEKVGLPFISPTHAVTLSWDEKGEV